MPAISAISATSKPAPLRKTTSSFCVIPLVASFARRRPMRSSARTSADGGRIGADLLLAAIALLLPPLLLFSSCGVHGRLDRLFGGPEHDCDVGTRQAE